MTKQKQEQAATPTPALFSLHPTLFFMFSSLDSNFQFTSAPAKATADDQSQGDDMRLSAMDRVKKRHEEKGFLYACFFMLCCCFCCHEACEHCLQCFCCCRSKDE
ncbi:protein CADMIUM TOLERANCE 4-like [Lolium rigidum]|uniref:protein CADMIUM TOLERANCE 4-like n=1 Tax=Lolium rigidum TaxID=89674 RepID=UPI001F5CBC02|nr:protein CADMIUM TOLERANCE 4-like [Lolium rigidum]